MDKLEKAIEAFEDEQSTLTLGERIYQLNDALMWHAWERVKLIKKHGVNSPKVTQHSDQHIAYMEQYSIIYKMYLSAQKLNKLSGKPMENLVDDFIQKIREMKSSVGDIIAVIPKTKKEEDN